MARDAPVNRSLQNSVHVSGLAVASVDGVEADLALVEEIADIQVLVHPVFVLHVTIALHFKVYSGKVDLDFGHPTVRNGTLKVRH